MCAPGEASPGVAGCSVAGVPWCGPLLRSGQVRVKTEKHLGSASLQQIVTTVPGACVTQATTASPCKTASPQPASAPPAAGAFSGTTDQTMPQAHSRPSMLTQALGLAECRAGHGQALTRVRLDLAETPEARTLKGYTEERLGRGHAGKRVGPATLP